jgi:hypothetical protein
MKYLKISFFLIGAILVGTGCFLFPDLEPAATPLVGAQTAFREKIFQPFFLNRRCHICHDFDAQRAGIFATHPDKTSNCTGCHSSTLLGFGPPDWKLPPDVDKWSDSSDPDAVREHIMELGPSLYNHLVGEGANKAPLVQWAFFNGPDTGPGAGQIHAGKVPTGGTGQEHPSGQIDNVDLLDWNEFKTAVHEWLCLEAIIPGSPDLGLPPSVTCP